MTAKELTEIAAAAGSAGIAREEITRFAEDAAKMGVAFDISADQAGEWMAKWRTSFGMTQDEVISLSDKINYLSNTTAANAEQISTIVTKIDRWEKLRALQAERSPQWARPLSRSA